MSITTSTCAQICNSPLNKSSAKQLYSFPKTTRFKNPGSKSYCNNFCYDLPGVQAKRKAGIGYANKYDFTKQLPKTPAANEYNKVGDFDFNKEKNKGNTFGISRANMGSAGILGNLNKYTPGPGTYRADSQLNKQPSFSFRARTTQNDPLNAPTKKYPGPGTYEGIKAMDGEGSYFNSKFSNSGALHFHPPRSKRFPTKNVTKDNPGPGQYEPNLGIQKEGKYFLSSFKASRCRSFPHDMRRTFSSGTFLHTPGPGSYPYPSEFGNYENATKYESGKSVINNTQKSTQ